MAHDVFISYSSDDKAVADATCATLEKRRIRCWVAPRDVPAGVPWAAALVDAIRGSKVVVLILSEGSNSSPQVIREVDEAVGDGIPVLPLRIDAVEPSEEMRFYIKSVHWLDAVTPPMQRHLEHLTNSVEALLSVDEDREPNIVPPAPETPPSAPPPEPRPRTLSHRTPPVWVVGLLAAVLIAGGGGWFLATQLNSTATAPTQSLVGEEPMTTAPVVTASGFEWFHSPVTDHYYALTDTGSWGALEAVAEQQGGHLIAINDEAEAQWLSSVFGVDGVVSSPGPYGQEYWIGLSRTATGEFRWTSGEPVTFTRWCPGEPTESYQDLDTDVTSVAEYNDGCWVAQSLSYGGFSGVIEAEEMPDPDADIDSELGER